MFSVAPNIVLVPNMTQNAERKHRTQNANTAHFQSSSRPHEVARIEPSFENVLQIKGFTEEHAEVFCSKTLASKDQEDAVLLFYRKNFMREGITFASPMLLQFICILVDNDPDMDLAGREVAKGDIYWRLVRAIYRKYCEGQNIRFNEDELARILDKFGKFALKTLKNKQSCFQREKIIRVLGENAFELGFLIGYEDFKLAANEAADIVVTFLHETIRTFLAYFHLHQRLFWRDEAHLEHSQRFDRNV